MKNRTATPNFDIQSDLLVEVFDELPLWAAPFGLKLLDNIRFKKDITVLDIGFGAGFPLTELAMRLGETCKIYGIDPWEAAIKRTEKKIKLYGIQNIEIIRGVAEQIPLKNESIDLITSNNGINNVSDLSKTLSECSRIMKKGGQFLQTMNTSGSFLEFYNVMELVLIDAKMDSAVLDMQKHIYAKRKPISEITDLLAQHNFSTNHVTNDQFIYKFTDGTTLLKHYFIRLAFLDGWKDIIPTDKQQVIFAQIEEILNEKAKELGFITLTVPFVVIDAEKTS